MRSTLGCLSPTAKARTTKKEIKLHAITAAVRTTGHFRLLIVSIYLTMQTVRL
jgi:hypothetical protein